MSENKPTTGSTWIDPDDAPEITADFFEQADEYIGDKLIRRGRPRKPNPKTQVTLRLNPEVVEFFKSTGDGWQTRMNDILEVFVSGARAEHSKLSVKVDVKRRPSKEVRDLIAMTERMQELLSVRNDKHEDKKRA